MRQYGAAGTVTPGIVADIGYGGDKLTMVVAGNNAAADHADDDTSGTDNDGGDYQPTFRSFSRYQIQLPEAPLSEGDPKRNPPVVDIVGEWEER